jgi:hypothetical protein
MSNAARKPERRLGILRLAQPARRRTGHYAMLSQLEGDALLHGKLLLRSVATAT